MRPRAIRAALRKRGWSVNRLADECKGFCGRMTVYRYIAGDGRTLGIIADRISAVLMDESK